MGRRRLARCFADTHLAADLRHLRSGLGLTEGVDDLRIGKRGCLHGDLVLGSGKIDHDFNFAYGSEVLGWIP